MMVAKVVDLRSSLATFEEKISIWKMFKEKNMVTGTI